MAEISRQFPEVLVVSLSQSEEIMLTSGVPSTVAKWNGIARWEILRQGAVKLKF